jgi:thiol:disulfide interchange protein DsbC
MPADAIPAFFHQPSRNLSVTMLLRITLGALCALFLTHSVQAKDDSEKLKQLLQQRLSEISITELKPSPIPGLYEMVFGSRIAYVSADGQYMLMGELIDLEGRRNLTAMRRGSLVLKSIDALGEANMIVFGPAKPKRTLTVFTDVDCPYCARLHKEVPKLNQAGVKVRYLLYPRAGKGSETYNRSVAVWCAKDRAQAIAVAKSGGKLEMKTCTNPVDEHVRLGHEVGVEGTPTIVMDDGRVLPGYAPAADLLAALGLQDGKKADAAR